MKITAIILLIACLQVSAKGNAQTVSISVSNAPLEKVFQEIKKQTGYKFFYEERLVEEANKVTLSVKGATIEQVLNLCFKDQPLTYTIIEKTIVVKKKEADTKNTNEQSVSLPPTIDVHGRVVDEKGQPVAGVNVMIKGTRKGVSTDDNGEFIIKSVDEDAVLVFTSVNMETFEVKVDGKTDLAVNLKTKITALKDVTVEVNTGYQRIPKERATGSFGFVNNELISRKVSSDILSRLDGVTSGVLFDKRLTAQAPVQIRGISSLGGVGSGPNLLKPLIIVDNFPYEGDLNNINPNDVENITILKDAAAASIWGARAGNGVIVITTKKGKFNQPTQISVTANTIITNKPNLFKSNQISTSDYIDVEKFLFQKGFFNSDINNTSSFPALTPVLEILNKQRLGQISAADADAQINALRGKDIRNDFLKYLYDRSISQQYAINLSGGNSSVKYYFSVGYDKASNRDNLVGNNNDRVTLRYDNTISLSKKLQISTGINLVQQSATNNSPGGYNLQTYKLGKRDLPPYVSFTDPNGNLAWINRQYRDSFTTAAQTKGLLNWRYNPIDELNNADNTIKQFDALLNLGVQYSFSRSINVQLQYNIERTWGENRSYNNLNTYYTRNLVNLFSQVSGTGINYIVPKSGILNLTNSNLISQGGRAQVNYDKRWGRHSINALGGMDIKQLRSYSHTGTTYGYNDNLLTFSRIDFVNRYPTYSNIGGTTNIPTSEDFTDVTNRFVSYYANVAYSYDNRITFSASARRDGSNLFGVNTNNKWAPLWSAGGKWDVSKEKFYHISVLPVLSTRLTYGYSGNMDFGSAAYTLIQYQSASLNPLNLPWANIFKPGNPELQWEKVGTLDIGIDYGFKNSRVDGSIDYFQKKSVDVLGQEQVDYTTGFFTILKNSANIKGCGVEVMINSRNLIGDFQWSSSLNFTYVKNEVTKYLLPLTQTTAFLSGGEVITPVVGYNPFEIVAYRWMGLDPLTGDPLGYLNKQASKDYAGLRSTPPFSESVVSVGQSVPKVYGNLLNTFSFGGFTCSANIVYSLGYYFKKSFLRYDGLFNSGTGISDFSKRWQQPGDEKFTNVPSMIYPYNSARELFYANSEIQYAKGDHIRLQDINLSYNLSTKTLKSITGLRLYAIVQNMNLLLWKANHEGIDPNFPNGVKQSPSFVLGMNINF